MQTLFLALFVSYVVAMAIVRLQRLHLPYTGDEHSSAIQKFHHGVVPRVGGVAVALGCGAALAWSGWRGLVGIESGWLLIAVGPAFAAGLWEDLTKRLGPMARLLATLAAGVLGAWLLQVQLTHVDIGWLDAWLGWQPVQDWAIAPLGLLLTVIGVAGLSNAINIIDGFHGLSAAVSILMFMALGYVGWAVGDALVVQVSLAMAGALLGFLVWNFPRGLIFLGDGGAYLTGFVLAQTGVLLTVRNPEVSAWFVLLVCAYPVTETLFSIYRKLLVRNVSPAMPDGLHLHMLVYRRLLRWAAGPAAARDVTRRNAATSPYLWALSSLSVMPAVLLWRWPWALQACTALYAAVYVLLYRRLVRFRSPVWLRRSVGAGSQPDSSR